MTEPKFTRETCEILMKELGITQTDFETQVPIGESKTPTICLAAAKTGFYTKNYNTDVCETEVYEDVFLEELADSFYYYKREKII
jgi:NAD dependent epimerase/dehydratase family enzyme